VDREGCRAALLANMVRGSSGPVGGPSTRGCSEGDELTWVGTERAQPDPNEALAIK
jgi:hypothetical protein